MTTLASTTVATSPEKTKPIFIDMEVPDPIGLAIMYEEDPIEYAGAIAQASPSIRFLWQIYATTTSQASGEFWFQVSQLPQSERDEFAQLMMEEDAFLDILSEEVEETVLRLSGTEEDEFTKEMHKFAAAAELVSF